MPNNREGIRKTPLLDDWRLHHSYEQTRDLFYRLYQQDAIQAVNVLNEEGLSFPSLYILQPEISKLSLETELGMKNMQMMGMLKSLITHRHPENDNQAHDTLKWMLQSGSSSTNLGEEYDTVMDLTALLLIKEYHDSDILPLLEEMIFSRHRKGLNTYDAEWALFESGDPECVSMVAKRLLSPDVRDVSMARRMLKFIPCISQSDDAQMQYRCVTQWLARNRRYLHYTGESNLKCSVPRPFKVSLDQKYLQQEMDTDTDWSNLRNEEQTAVTAFRQLGNEDQELLGDYSHYLHSVGGGRWQRWINSDVNEQIAQAKRWQGVNLI